MANVVTDPTVAGLDPAIAAMLGSGGLDQSAPFTIGGGSAYLPYYTANNQLLSSLYLGQGGLGQNLLDTLTKLRQDPASGPLGLAAYDKYGGGAQSIAAGTQGKGISTPYQSIFDRLLQGLSGSVMNPGSPFNPDNNGQFNPSAAKVDPNNAPAPNPQAAAEAPGNQKALIDAYKAYHNGALPDGFTQGADGSYTGPGTPPAPKMASGGVVVQGEPHWIVTGQGVPVAQITEDGKPEHVGGMGGIEVTPLDPARKAAYEASKAHGSLLGDMENEIRRATTPQPGIVHAITGVQALFPQYNGSQVNTQAGAPSGTNMLPTSGGTDQSRESQVAATSPFKADIDANGNPTLPTGANDIERYAKLLGGALSSGNHAVNMDAISSLNQGKLPNQLLSSEELGSMPPDQQVGYLNLLQQAGLGSVNDLKAQIKAFTPVALH